MALMGPIGDSPQLNQREIEGLRYDPAQGKFVYQPPAQMDYATGQFENTPVSSNVYDDLPGPLAYVKDQLAAGVKRRRNVSFHFDPARRHLTVEEQAAREEEQRQAISDQAAMNQVLKEYGQLSFSDPSEAAGPFDELTQMVDTMPRRPERVEPMRPSEGALIVAGLASLAGGSKSLQILSLPWQYESAKAERATAEGQQAWADEMQRWQIKFGLTRERAQAVANVMATQDKARSEKAMKILTMAWEAAQSDTKRADDWNKLIYQGRADFAKMTAEHQATYAAAILESALDPLGGAASRQMNAELFNKLTGLDIEAFTGVTPQERSQLLEDALRVAQTQKTEFETGRGQTLLPGEVVEQGLRNEGISLDNAIKQFNLDTLPERTKLELAQGYMGINKTMMEIQKLRRVGANGTEEDWRVARRNMASALQAMGNTLTSSIGAKEKELADAKATRASLEQGARRALADKLIKPSAGGFLGIGKVTQAQADKQNAEIVAEYLRENPQYAQVNQLIGQLEGQRADLVDRQKQIEHLKFGSERIGVVASAGKKLGKYKTADAVTNEVAAMLDRGEVTAAEAVKILENINTAILTEEQRIDAQRFVLTTAAHEAGIADAEAYADAVLGWKEAGNQLPMIGPEVLTGSIGLGERGRP